MRKGSKGFLVPVAAAVAALTTASAQASVGNVPPISGQPDEQQGKSASQISGAEIGYTLGDELHALILAPNEHGVILAAHASHRSHASHQSHRSHYSSS